MIFKYVWQRETLHSRVLEDIVNNLGVRREVEDYLGEDFLPLSSSTDPEDLLMALEYVWTVLHPDQLLSWEYDGSTNEYRVLVVEACPESEADLARFVRKWKGKLDLV